MSETHWHGSATDLDKLDPSKTADGGLHIGTLAQARMRCSRILYEIRADPHRIRRCRDLGGGWKDRIRSARASGFDAIVYLNRYEGIPVERIETLAASGDLDRLDSVDDRAFRRLVPEAQDSLILLNQDCFRIVHKHVHSD